MQRSTCDHQIHESMIILHWFVAVPVYSVASKWNHCTWNDSLAVETSLAAAAAPTDKHGRWVSISTKRYIYFQAIADSPKHRKHRKPKDCFRTKLCLAWS